MKKGKILITGSMGYIGGANLMKLSQDYEIDGIDLNYHQYLMKYHTNFYRGDFAEVSGQIDLSIYDHIFHFAAMSDIGTAEKNPGECYENNVAKTITLLNNIVKSSKKPRFHFASSGSVVFKSNPYSRSKFSVEEILNDYKSYPDFEYTVYRYYNVIGSIKSYHGQAPGRPHIFSKLFDSYLHKKPFYINDYSYNTKDGSCIRDYIDINDLVEVHKKSLEIKGLNGIVFPVCTGHGFSVKECIDIFQNTFYTDLNIEHRPTIKGDVASLIGSASITKAMLSWSPEYTLENSLNNLNKWYTSYTYKQLERENVE